MGVPAGCARFRVARVLGVVVLGAGLVLGMGPAGAVEPPAEERGARPGEATGQTALRAARVTTVTLLTGDQVRVSGTGENLRASVRPGPGRREAGISFRRYTVGERLYVIPSDVAPQVAAGALDRRLFDVTGLIEAEYDDAHLDDIPLIITYREGGARTMMAAPGARTTRTLDAVHGAAVRVEKAEAARFLAHFPRTRQGIGGGVEQIWLDGKAEVLLDQSVPQIGAPQAWQAGFTGEGVTVGVLDTGIDETHPDLAGAVVATEDFTGEGPADGFGHGTHVASIITGSGAASDGRYQGVAPDARLLNGKVCDSEGSCAESWIIAGMEWAATEQDADVVNLSLGGFDSPGVDPMEAAVDRLTDETGALFVIAAGNDGPGAETISSPGSADRALTVGAVDKNDRIAEFSSRGPRVGDGAVKPDLTAPGVDIVAARAEGTQLGDPVGDAYVRASGTSMATPHVAGAAAILAQQHPDWGPDRLKSRLMGSARFNAALTVYDQGAGRLNVSAAIERAVLTTPASLSFGTQEWPHDDDQPVTRTLTYHNAGTVDQALRLTGMLIDPEGREAPDGALRLSASDIVVPAGATTTVRVTVDTAHDGPDGAYSGWVWATGAEGTLTTPLGVVKEAESYDLTLRAIGRDGEPAMLGADLLSHTDEYFFESVSEESGETVLRLPRGEYFVQAFVEGAGENATGGTEPAPQASWTGFLVQPRVTLDRDVVVTADVRRAEPMRQTVQAENAELALADIGYAMRTAWGEFGFGLERDGLEGLYTAHLGAPSDDLVASLGSHWGRPGPDGTFANSPYVYSLLEQRPRRFWTGYDEAVRDRDLARVRTLYHAQAQGRTASVGLVGDTGQVFTLGPEWSFDPPARTTHYLTPGDGSGVVWDQLFLEYVETDQGLAEDLTLLLTEDRSYRAGRHSEDWNTPVFGPQPASPFTQVSRDGDALTVVLPMYSDGDEHAGDSDVDSGRTVLYRDGIEVARSDLPGNLYAEGLPEAEAEFVLQTTAGRSSVSDLTTRQTSRWSFRSARPSGQETQVLPLWSARFRPNADERVTRLSEMVDFVPVTFETVAGAEAGEIRRPRVWASTDDGSSWQRAPLIPAGHNTWLAVVRAPRNAGFVSLRAAATDTLGNSVRQTIIRAYRLP